MSIFPYFSTAWSTAAWICAFSATLHGIARWSPGSFCATFRTSSTQVEQDKTRPLSRKQLGNRIADSRRGPRNQRHLPVEPEARLKRSCHFHLHFLSVNELRSAKLAPRSDQLMPKLLACCQHRVSIRLGDRRPRNVVVLGRSIAPGQALRGVLRPDVRLRLVARADDRTHQDIEGHLAPELRHPATR